MHSSTSSSIPQPLQPTSTNGYLDQSILKRKRNQSELSSHSSSSSTWFGLAFQFPSVIKKEFNDFVKTIKGGYSQAMEGNFIDPTGHEPPPPLLFSSTSTSLQSKLKKSHPNRTHLKQSHRSQTNPTDRQSQFKKPLSTFPFRRSSNRKIYNQTDESDIIDQPTPPKKLRLSNSTGHTDHPSLQPSNPTRLSASSGPTCSPRLLSINAQLANSRAMSLHPCQVEGGDLEGEEILESGLTATGSQPFGSNSVQFPDSEQMSVDGVDQNYQSDSSRAGSASKSYSMDINRTDPQEQDGKHLKRHSSDLNRFRNLPQTGPPILLRTLMEQSTSSSESSPFSLTGQSYFSRGQFSSHTSLTSTTSTIVNPNADNQSRTSSVTSPRPRHTKLLGGPRPGNRPYTLSATSPSSLNSFCQADRPHHQLLSNHPNANLDTGHHLIRANTISLNNLNEPHHPWTGADDECEQLTNELTSGIHNRLHFHSPQVEPRSASSYDPPGMRPKVPLDEVIGKPSLPNLRQFPKVGSQATLKCGVSYHTLRDLPTNPTIDPPLSAAENESTTGSTSTTNTSSLNPPRFALSGNPRAFATQFDQTVAQGLSFASSDDNSCSPRPNPDTIAELDEPTGDISYELLERPDWEMSPKQSSEKKRKRGLMQSYRGLRKGFANGEPSSSIASKAISPGHPKPNQKIKVMKKLGLIKSPRVDPDAMEEDSPDDDLRNVTPTKKIRVLEDEVQKLRRELESERLLHSREMERSQRLNSLLMSRSKPDDHFRTSNSPLNNQISRVRFSPRSAWSPSSASGSASRSYRKFHSSTRQMNTLADTPVLIKKPSEGALVGGSPFVVSRVYGQGPEVIGEKTPEAAYKRQAKLKALGASQHTARRPGLAQDLFGAGLSSTANARDPSQASALADPTRWKGKGRECAPDPLPSTSASRSSSGWVRDSELEHDLFDRPDAKKLHRQSLGRSSSFNVSDKMSSSTRVFNPISKPANVYRNSIGGSTSSQGPDRPTPDMTSFLNELKSSGKDKLRKTVDSLKYYNPQQHFGSQKATVISADRMPLPRNLDPQNAELINLVIGQTFGSQSALKLSASQTTSQQFDPTRLSRPRDVTDDHSVESSSNTSLLSRKVYPSSMSFGTRPNNKASSSSSPRPTLLSSVANRNSFHVEPKADAASHTSQVNPPASSTQVDGTERPRLTSDPTQSPSRANPVTNNLIISQTSTKSGLKPRSGKGIDLGSTRLSKAETFGQSIPSRPLSVIDPNRLPPHPSILSPSKSNEGSPFMRSMTSLSTNSSSTTRKVRIVEDPAAFKRSSLRSSTHTRSQQQARSENSNNMTDENLGSVEEEEEEIVGVGTGVRKPNTVVGYGVEPGKAISTSGSDWIVVKSDSNRLGDGEPNLRRWNLKPLAMISAHPKIMDEN